MFSRSFKVPKYDGVSRPVTSTTSIKPSKSKLNYAKEILEKISSLNQDLSNEQKESIIKNIVSLRKSLKSASRPTMKSVYLTQKARNNAKKLVGNFDSEYNHKIKQVDDKIFSEINKIHKNKQNLIKSIEPNVINIYKNNSIKRNKLVEILKTKNIKRNISQNYEHNKEYNWRVSRLAQSTGKFIGRTGRNSVNRISSFGKATGLSSAASAVGKYTGLNQLGSLSFPTGTKERVKQLKLDVQALKQQKKDINEQIEKINLSILSKKQNLNKSNINLTKKII